MPRPEIAIYQDGDEVRDRCGNRGFVRRCFSKAKRVYYLRVRVVEGPRKGEWDWPEKFDRPALDWDADEPITRCQECEREFRGGKDDMGFRRIFCRQCQRRQDAHAKAISDSPTNDQPALKRARWIEEHGR